MTTNIPILIPGERFELDVILCPEGGLTPIERLVIRAILAGENRFESLVDLFGLGHRSMLDLISDLWKSGYLYLDIPNGTVHVSEDIREKEDAIKEKKDDLDSGWREVERVSLVHDLFADHILPVLSVPTGNANPIVVPNLKDYGSYRDVPPTRMSDEVERALARRRNRQPPSIYGQKKQKSTDKSDGNWQGFEKPMRVIGVAPRRASELTEAGQVQRWFTHVEIQLNTTDSGRFAVRVVQPDNLDARIRRDWEDKLSRFIDEQPDSAFAKRLREKAGNTSQGKHLSLSLFQEIEKLQADIAKFDTEKGYAPSAHGRWERDASGLIDRLNRHAAHRSRVDFIESENLEKTLLDAIGTAQEQLVISSPNPDHERYLSFQAALYQALGRGVRVFLLRDIRAGQEIDKKLLHAFLDLEKEGRFFWIRQRMSSRTNESFLIRDREEVIFTTARFLDKSPNTKYPFTIRVRGAEDNTPCGVAMDLLERVQRNLPEHRLVNNLRLEPSDVQTQEDYLIPGERKFPDLPRPPPEPNEANNEANNKADKDRSALYAARIDLWYRAWKDFAGELSTRHAALAREDFAELIADGEHNDLLLEILDSKSSQNLLIVSGSASFRGLTPDIQQRIQKRVEGGAEIELILGRILDKTAGNRINDLNSYAGFNAYLAPGCRGLLASDEKFLITSMDLLAPDRRPAAQRLESGVVLTGSGFISKGQRWFEKVRPKNAKPIQWMQPEERDVSLEEEDLPEKTDHFGNDIQHLFERISTARQGDGPESDSVSGIMAEWFRERTERDTYWQYLEELSKYPEPDLRRVAISTALLKATKSRKKEQDYSHWLAWLTVERWQTEKFVEALLFMEYGNPMPKERGTLPPPWIAELAVLQGGDKEAFQLALMDAQEKEKLAPEEIDALLCIAGPALLAHGTIEAHEVLLMFKDQCQSGVIDWIEPVFDYWNDTGRPLPERALHNREGAAHAKEQERTAFEQLQTAFRDANPTNLIKKEISLIQDTWKHLFSPEGEYGQIALMLAEKESVAMRKLLEHWKTKHMTPEKIMDDASKQVWIANGSIPTRDKRIKEQRNKRSKYLDKLNTLASAMQAWIETQDSLVQMEDTLFVERADQLANKLRISSSKIDGLLSVWREARDFRAPLLHCWHERMREILGV
uniref:Uncharacterized protein n=1 Tax=Candidatus Kentrum sp. MB TaxID=2138164 RepID=A0A450XWI9_9GAMM|nr:MAG: hypothetical protein BECKMB1821G_GA0114241_10504 [Candidatus Kentron sp. MB]VFK33626.1 MAG: hypothetical protein BECKMB1821I_GA0114274_10503 [Candidatus Kentron sp. MB]VFK76334.1 MAG: hypothetical protein BECKMB1821H_GA0114242_10523 [Candidatus Kentron sp. MB]